MISFLKNLFVVLLVLFLTTNCQLGSEKIEADEFIGIWLLSEIESVNHENKVVILPLDDINRNKITAKKDKSFTAYLEIMDKKQPEITGSWERTDESVISLSIDKKIEKIGKIIMLKKQQDYYILVSNVFDTSDSTINYKFKKK